MREASGNTRPSRNRRARRGERGVSLVLGALWVGAIGAVLAIAVEVGRLTDTATEVQVAADAAALAAAEDMVKGGTAGAGGTAERAGRDVAERNRADGRAPKDGEVAIEFGNYSVAAGFVPGAAANATRATVTLSDPPVLYVLASILGSGSSTTVTKRAVAKYVCNGTHAPTAPIAIGDCQLHQYTGGQQCSTSGITLTLNPDPTQNACWIANPSSDAGWFPPESPAGGQQAPLSVGDSITARNGSMIPIFRDWQTCVETGGSACVSPGNTGSGIHDFVIPVVPCPINNCNNGTTIGTVVGFATIHVNCPGDIICPGCDKPPRVPRGVPGGTASPSVTFTQICNNDAAGTGGGSGAAECFGSGSVRLVDDR